MLSIVCQWLYVHVCIMVVCDWEPIIVVCDWEPGYIYCLSIVCQWIWLSVTENQAVYCLSVNECMVVCDWEPSHGFLWLRNKAFLTFDCCLPKNIQSCHLLHYLVPRPQLKVEWLTHNNIHCCMTSPKHCKCK